MCPQIAAYFAFTATIVLYIYVIQQRASPLEVYSSYLVAATRCQSHIAAMAEKGSLSERYCLVLEELRVEALRQASTPPTTLDDDAAFVATCTGLSGESTCNTNDTSVGRFPDSSGWDQFASMVSAGLGNLDLFQLNDNSFHF